MSNNTGMNGYIKSVYIFNLGSKDDVYMKIMYYAFMRKACIKI